MGSFLSWLTSWLTPSLTSKAQSDLDPYRARELEAAFLAQQSPQDRSLTPGIGHRRFGEFALRFVAPGSSMLDVGCGEGAMVRVLSEGGLRVHGVDVRPRATRHYQEAKRAGEWFTIGSGSDLPFADASFDAVGFFHVLEHVYDPARLLAEGTRVLKPGGHLIVVSPNLLSPVHTISALLSAVRGTDGFHLFRHRDPPTSPFGNHVPETLSILVRNTILTIYKLMSGSPRPSHRTPDWRYMGWGDSDSIYLINPIELRQWIEQRGLGIRAYQGEGTTGRLGVWAGGVWIAACKPEFDKTV